MFTFKIQYMENFFMLRGNHECANINRVYGFLAECVKRYASARIWTVFQVDERKKKSDELSDLEKKKENQISKLAYKLETSKKELDSLIEAQERTEREIQELIKRKGNEGTTH